MRCKYLNFIMIFILSINWTFGKPSRDTTIPLGVNRIRRSDTFENLKDLIAQKEKLEALIAQIQNKTVIVPTARPSQPRPTIRTNLQSIATQNRPKPVPAVSGPASIDCQWSSWSAWTQCSVTCGTGTKTKLRSKIKTSRNSLGLDCTGASTTSSKCTGIAAVPGQCRSSSQTNSETRRTSSNRPKTKNTVLVITGNRVAHGSLPSEVFDLSNQESNCANLENIPMRSYAAGGLINNTPIVCGGVDVQVNQFGQYKFGDYIDECVLIGKSKKFPMVSKRYTHTAVNLDSSRIWILGGSNSDVSYLNTTEIVSINKSVKGIDLPLPWRFGCAVNVNNKIYLIGGKRNYDVTNKVWIVDPSNGFNIKEGPQMNYSRRDHMCGVMPDEQTIVVAGGSGKKVGRKTEFYDIKSATWKIGPDLPFKLQLSQMVTSSDGVMLIGGDEKVGRRYKKEFLKLKSLNSEWEIQSKLHLSEGRNAHLVIPIPEEITNC